MCPKYSLEVEYFTRGMQQKSILRIIFGGGLPTSPATNNLISFAAQEPLPCHKL